MESMESHMNFNNIKKEMDRQKSVSLSQAKQINENLCFGIDILDSHISKVLDTTDASYAQVSMAALTVIGHLLAHGGVKENTSLYFVDCSATGTGKSHNLTVQYNLLLQDIAKIQDNLQLINSDDENVDARYMNINRGKITTAALNKCIRTVPAQLLIIDELGLLIQRDDDLISVATKLYGAKVADLNVTSSERPTGKNIVPVAFSFMGATTLSYFGGSKAVMKHMNGGFLNRSLIAYHTELIKSEDITSIRKDKLDYKKSNEEAIELLNFAKTCNVDFDYTKDAEELLVKLKQEVQIIILKYHDMGTEFGAFYMRVVYNTQTIINILHSLKCFYNKKWIAKIDAQTVSTAISFVREVVLVEIDKLIHYLSDGELLEKEERNKNKINDFVKDYLEKKSKMPKIRDISLKTRLSKSQILDLTKDYLEIVPGTTIFKYCERI